MFYLVFSLVFWHDGLQRSTDLLHASIDDGAVLAGGKTAAGPSSVYSWLSFLSTTLAGQVFEAK